MNKIWKMIGENSMETLIIMETIENSFSIHRPEITLSELEFT